MTASEGAPGGSDAISVIPVTEPRPLPEAPDAADEAEAAAPMDRIAALPEVPGTASDHAEGARAAAGHVEPSVPDAGEEAVLRMEPVAGFELDRQAELGETADLAEVAADLERLDDEPVSLRGDEAPPEEPDDMPES